MMLARSLISIDSKGVEFYDQRQDDFS